MIRDGLPTGVVTFLMSDVEGSAEHWVSNRDQMTIAVRDLDGVVADVSETRGGAVLKSRGEGDSHFVVFDRPSSAVASSWLDERDKTEAANRVRRGAANAIETHHDG